MFETRSRLHLGFNAEKDTGEFFNPVHLSMKEFITQNKFIFNALHGGAGEDGSLQALFEKNGVRYNGSDVDVSRLCIDKGATAEHIRNSAIRGVSALPSISLSTDELLRIGETNVRKKWNKYRRSLGARTLVIKPQDDGCSSGIAHLYTYADFIAYIRIVRLKTKHIPAGTFRNQHEVIEMPTKVSQKFLIERFVETDVLRVKQNRLKHRRITGLVEITIGVIEQNSRLHVLNPSITIAEGDVLSVEEKFQGGTGVNLTPPPVNIIRSSIVQKIKERIETLAQKIGIRGYARIDCFANTRTGELSVIEINTLPGLTPSTVLYHQALAEDTPQYPRQFLEMLIQNKGY